MKTLIFSLLVASSVYLNAFDGKPILESDKITYNQNHTFQYIQDNIFAIHNCVFCHNDEMAGNGVKLNTYENVLQTLVVGFPEESKLYLAIRQPGGTMPPESQLSNSEQQYIYDWILGGAAP